MWLNRQVESAGQHRKQHKMSVMCDAFTNDRTNFDVGAIGQVNDSVVTRQAINGMQQEHAAVELVLLCGSEEDFFCPIAPMR